MRKSSTPLGVFVFVLSLTLVGHGQSLPTASAKARLQVGAGYTYAKPDYGQKPIQGASVFADYDFASHVGIEATIHYVAFVTPLDLAENTYFVGPRFFLARGRYTAYAKVLAGYGDLLVQEVQDNVGRPDGFYFAYAIGAGLDIRASDRITIRAFDFESQRWPNYGNGLAPTVYTFGAAYHFH